MRGVPSLMRPRITSSLPPAVSLDNRGPKVRALICGGKWQIPQDWAKTWRPNFCVAVNPSSVAACCADATPAASTPKSSTPERTAERIAALRFILNPPDIFFCKPTPAQCQAEGLDPEPGGLTGMRSGGASATICGWATRATGRRSVMPTQPFQKDGSLIELAQGIGADTLSIVCTGRMCVGGSNNRSRWSAQMLPRLALACVTAIAMASSLGFAQAPSPSGVKTLNPPRAIKAEGTWSLGARAGDFVFVAGMQGVDPATNTLVQDPYARIRQAFLNITLIAQSEGASLQDCVRLAVYVSDLHRFAPMVDKVQAELWSKPPYPPRTMIEVQRLFDDDIVEIDSVFYAPARR